MPGNTEIYIFFIVYLTGSTPVLLYLFLQNAIKRIKFIILKRNFGSKRITAVPEISF